MELEKAKKFMRKSGRTLCIVGAGTAGLTITVLAFLYTIQAIGVTLVFGLFLIGLWRLRNA